MLTPEQFMRVCRLADRLAGIALQERHRELIGQRMRRHALEPGSLLDGAEHGDEASQQRLIGLLTTNHTAFFRNPQQLDLAAEHVLWAAHRRGSARIWSAAVSTGEEAWSLALAVLTAFGHGRPPVSILASDIDADALAVAEAGAYPQASLAAIPGVHRRLGLLPEGGMAPDARAMIRFARVNLIDLDWPVAAPLDVVCCRNVLMYLGPDHRYAILERIASLLATDGMLLLDPSEHPGSAAHFFTTGRAGVYGLRSRNTPQRVSHPGTQS